MLTCVGCKYAEWKTTSSGRLHPSGDGKCTYDVVMPVLPACRTWASWGHPVLTYPWISRKKGLHKECPHYEAGKGK